MFETRIVLPEKRGAAYEKQPTATIVENQMCDVCGAQGVCLCADNSEKEYSDVRFCVGCLQNILARMQKIRE
jgi:hypothetical protein